MLSNDPEGVKGMEARLKFSFFNLIIEFVVFGLVAFFNYSWLEKIVDLDRFKRGSIPIINQQSDSLFYPHSCRKAIPQCLFCIDGADF